jgi:hypothetical protein
VPPAEFTAKLPAPPLFNAHTARELALDDQLRMKLLGVCIVANNGKAGYIAKQGIIGPR